MKKSGSSIKAILLISGMISLFGCSAFFETNIEEETIEILSPIDSLVSSNLTITFWWNRIDGADRYKLQVVSTDFDHVTRIIADTSLSTDKFQWTFTPGAYSWRIKAYNSGYSTAYQYGSFRIDTVNDLSNQQILLVFPPNQYAGNSTQVKLQWMQLYSATNFRVVLERNHWGGEAMLDTLLEKPVTTLTLPLEGIYYWGVQAINSKSNTPYSVRTFTIDRTPPARPGLLFPADDDSVSTGKIDLTWVDEPDEGSPIYDQVYVSADSSDFSNHVIFTEENQSEKATLEIELEGDYYWRVISRDAAGNEGLATAIRNFHVVTD
jgi:hypothetical protein